MDNYKNLFKILFKIIIKKHIDFDNLFIKEELLSSEALRLKNFFINHFNKNLIEKFNKFYLKEKQQNKNILILPLKTPNNLFNKYNNQKNIVKKENILDGFIYLDKKKYILYDRSLKQNLEEYKKICLKKLYTNIK